MQMLEIDIFGGYVDKKREEVRDWVIQLSMDQQVGPKHPFMLVIATRFNVPNLHPSA